MVLTRIECEGVAGYGEASLPPYLGETQASVIQFLRKVDLSAFSRPEISTSCWSMSTPSRPAIRQPKPQLISHCMIWPEKMSGLPCYMRYGLSLRMFRTPLLPSESTATRWLGKRHGGDRRVQYIESQGGWPGRQTDDQCYPFSHRFAAGGRCQPGLGRPTFGAGDDLLDERAGGGDGGNNRCPNRIWMVLPG